MHLNGQRAVDVSDFNATFDKTLCGLKDEAVLLVLSNRKIESALDGFGLRLGMQRSLGTFDLGSVQLKVFVSSFGKSGQ